MGCLLCNRFQGHGPLDNNLNDRRHYVPRFTWNELLDSSSSCYCCDILIRGCRGCLNQHSLGEADIAYGSLKFRYQDHPGDIEEQETTKLIVISFQNGKKFLIEMFAVDGPADLKPSSWEDWIGECLDDHADSLSDLGELPPLPTRVVDVGLEDGVVKLVETQGDQGIYVCLSHCWGRRQIITTTHATFDKHKRSIAWDSLSQTFRDAIFGVRTLGIRMASIYRNGYFTIAATHSPNGERGLYFREMIDHHLEAVGQCDDEIGNPTAVYFPLLTRAWVYQERMLSTRIIHFGRYELFFECRPGIQCECGHIEDSEGGPGSWQGLFKVEFATMLRYYDLARMGRDRPGLQYHGAGLWRTIVSCYSGLFLTKSSDRLPAIGGMAKDIAARRHTIEHCEIKPATVDEFGHIANGSLTISGLAREGVLQYEVDSGGSDGSVETTASCYVSFSPTQVSLYGWTVS
ncbi:hypothetical protein BDW59DRAFT_179578 [Aspergillus cavernicola]|uniref:Heterokaryon incompatibility domain-containing protein n=1 Tax=Aspergillus cavernicola TaxID=176166 RepID=A0ABR4IFE7_9EURO